MAVVKGAAGLFGCLCLLDVWFAVRLLLRVGLPDHMVAVVLPFFFLKLNGFIRESHNYRGLKSWYLVLLLAKGGHNINKRWLYCIRLLTGPLVSSFLI